MFEVNCPHCNKVLKLNHRSKLIFYSEIECVHCSRLVRVKQSASLSNSIFIGCLIGVGLTMFFDSDIPSIIVVTLVSVFTLQKIVDVFYPLESAEDFLWLNLRQLVGLLFFLHSLACMPLFGFI